MTKLTAANSPLLHVVKDETNNRVFKNASKIANIDGEAAVIDYLMVLYRPDAQPAARKRYTALIAGQSKLLDTIREWFGANLFRIAALEYAKDGETAAIDTVCGARCHSQEESARLRGLLEQFIKPPTLATPGELGIMAGRADAADAAAKAAPRVFGEYYIGEKLIVSPAYQSDTMDDGYHPVFKPGELVTVFKIAAGGVEVGYSESVFDRLWIDVDMMPYWFDREEWDTRPVQGPLSFAELSYFRLIAEAEAYGSPLDYRDFSEARTLEGLGFIELIEGIKLVPEHGAYPGYIVTEPGLAYLADILTAPPVKLNKSQEIDLIHVAACESSGFPSVVAQFSTYEVLEANDLIERIPGETGLDAYILTDRGLAYLSNAGSPSPVDPISDSARGRVVMAKECSYWRGIYGDPGPFTEMFDELVYWRKTRGMPPINAVPALDKLINDQIDYNPALAAQLGLTRR
jgi:hypothetical protein